MKKLNQDLLFREIYLNIKQRNPIDFIANRADIGFNNIENEFTSMNFALPFRLPEAQNLNTVIKILLHESTGIITMEPYDKLKLLVKVLDGGIFYEKIGNGDEWRVMIGF